MAEIWETIPETIYEASTLGRIRNTKTGRVKVLVDGGDGYLRTNIYDRSRKSKVHRVMASVYLDTWDPKLMVDHIDGNRGNNSVGNLRMVTASQNSINRVGYGRSGYKGVYERASGRFVAKIKSKGVTYGLGYYDTAELAARAYNKKATELHGEYARLNKVLD